MTESIDGEFCRYTLGKPGASAAHLDPMKKGRCMCETLGGGKHIAPAAVLYDAEAEWAGERMPMQKAAFY